MSQPACKHKPEWSTTAPADGAPGIVDVWCRCGISGSVRIEPAEIQWDDHGERDVVRTIGLPCYNMRITLFEGGGGELTSDLGDGHLDPECDSDVQMLLDGIESMVLAHACAGVDVGSPAYINGIESAVDAAHNRIGHV